jgi:hypothetical protein
LGRFVLHWFGLVWFDLDLGDYPFGADLQSAGLAAAYFPEA